MAEDLAKAIVLASEKMHKEESSFKGISLLAESLEKSRGGRDTEIVPLYEHIEKIECWDNDTNSFRLCSLKTWYSLDAEVNQQYSSIFVALSSILSQIHMSQCYHNYSYYQDKQLEKAFIGRIVQLDKIENESKNHKQYREKRIAALFKRNM